MGFLQYFDIIIAIGIIVLALYLLKKHHDRTKKREEFESTAKYLVFPSSDYHEYRKWRANNRTITFLIMPFLIAIVYIVLRLNGTIGNPFL